MIGFTPGQVSHCVTGRNSISSEFAKNIAIAFPALNLEWIFTGKGEMLKQGYTPAFDDTARMLPPDATFFNSNLPLLIAAFESDESNLSSLILSESTTLNDLKNNVRGPSLRLLIRLRERWGISIDDMLFADLTHPGTMDDLKNKTGENLQIKQALETLTEKVKALEDWRHEKGQTTDTPKNTVDKDDIDNTTNPNQ